MVQKKMIYISTYNFDDIKSNGVAKKIISQVRVFKENGIQVDYTYTSNMEAALFVEGKKREKLSELKGIKGISCWKAIKRYLKKNQYDYAYIRHPGRIDPWGLSALRQLRENGVKVIYEFPTFPYDNISNTTLNGKLDLVIDHLYRRKLKNYVERVVTFYGQDSIFGINTIKLMNGISVSEIAPVKHKLQDDCIDLLVVAKFHKYHGCDRIIQSMANYYQQGGDRNIKLHIVGAGSILENYKTLVDQCELQERVIFYGNMSGEELDKMYEIADIGLGFFRAYESNLSSSSALKIREYLAKGIPVISGCKEDIFMNENSDFYLEFPNDNSSIDMQKIIDFYDGICCEQNSGELSVKIHDFAKKNADWTRTLLPVINYIVYCS